MVAHIPPAALSLLLFELVPGVFSCPEAQIFFLFVCFADLEVDRKHGHTHTNSVDLFFFFVMNSSHVTRGTPGEEWSLHIFEAGEPPFVLVNTVWLLVSFCVALLFLIIRPAATRRVRQDPLRHPAPLSHGSDDVHHNTAYTQRVWQVLTAVWTLALYDVVHRTCCYLQLSPYMLARHQLLPLGVSFLRDGVWTEWVNWVRLYLQCSSSLTTAAAAATPSSGVCVGWQLPLAGVLDYRQYPEYAALNASRLPSSAEVDLYHKMSLEAMVVTAVAVVQLHSAASLIRQVFYAASPASKVGTAVEEAEPCQYSAGEEGTHDPHAAAALLTGPLKSTSATARKPTEAPGDDSCVDSPEALAEEEAWREEESAGQRGAGGNSSGTSFPARTASSTTHLLLQCWPCFLAAGYATMYAYVGGLPLLMTLVFPCATVSACILAMSAST